MKENKVKKLIIVVLVILLISIGVLFAILNGTKENTEVIENNPSKLNNLYLKDIAEYDEYSNLNKEFIGIIKFESNLIDLPFVKAEIKTTAQDAYDKYLRTAWDTMEHDEEGSIFMDPYNHINDQNLVLYGHYVYPEYDPSGSHKFTPLHLLKEESNYESNKYIDLILKNEVRRYEISNVYYAKTDTDSDQPLEKGMEYMFSNFNDDALEYYMKRVNEEEFYDTGVEIGPDDKFLTLQTCVENRDDLKLIVIAKEIEVIEIR